jgi:opacity protein-like surface antigen
MNNTTQFSLAAALLVGSFAYAQPISVGVKGGVPLTDAFETFQGNQSAYFTNTHRYTIGPTVEFHLPLRFSVEIDALYSRLGYDNRTTAPSFSTTRANSWEFPVLGKFEILPGPIRPFVDAGVNIRNISGLKTVRQFVSGVTFNQVSLDSAPEFNKDTDFGFTFGAGVTFKAGWLRLSPEFRYTRWGGENFRDPINALLRTNRNQGTFLVG